MTDELHAYLVEATLTEPDLLRRLREETASHPKSNMQIAPEQGQFMQLLVRMIGAKHTLEIGTFTGYSSLAVALALPDDGTVTCCDVSDEYTSIARRYWAEAGLQDKITLHLGPGLDTLDRLIADGKAETYDFFFADADKENSDNYYERALTLLRPGGLFANDNALSHGRVVNPDDSSLAALDALNRKITQDPRVVSSLVPIADGLLLAWKKP
jgi:predicted O-methyltransferase YrrM